jgi:hypothetical protein
MDRNQHKNAFERNFITDAGYASSGKSEHLSAWKPDSNIVNNIPKKDKKQGAKDNPK